MSRDVNDQPPTILTNMAFWQSPAWQRATESIYPVAGARSDPPLAPAPLEAFRLWAKARRYDLVVTMGVRTSFLYALLCAVTRRPSRQIMTEVFIDARHPSNPLWQVKTQIYRHLARRAMGVLTNSSAEVDAMAERYGLPREKLRYVPMHTNIHEPRMPAQSDGTVFSAGRTLRDYPTLLRAASRIDAPLTVICGHRNLRGIRPPGNVTILCDVPRATYLQHLEACAVAVVPLSRTERATGQVVVLEAMALGKPVVATRAAGTLDHIRDGVNGLLVDIGDDRALAEAVNRLLRNPDWARRLGEQALEDVCSHHTIEAHAQAKLDAIRDLWLRARAR